MIVQSKATGKEQTLTQAQWDKLVSMNEHHKFRIVKKDAETIPAGVKAEMEKKAAAKKEKPAKEQPATEPATEAPIEGETK